MSGESQQGQGQQQDPNAGQAGASAQQGAQGEGAQTQAAGDQGQQGAPGQGAQQQGQGSGAAATLAGGNADAGQGKAAPATFPDNWRELLAGDDKDLLAELGRSKTPADLAKRVKDLRAELAKKPAGAKLEPPGKDAKPEEVAEWRKANGIPEKAEDYGNALALPEGMVLGDADKPVAESFFKAAHAANLPQPFVNEALKWYFAHQEQNDIARQNADDEAHDTSAAKLREEWGAADFKRNINAIGATLQPLFKQHGEDLFDRILLARMPDGRRIGDDAAATKALVDLALNINPMARTIPADPAQVGRGMADRRAQIEAMIGQPPDKATGKHPYFDNEAIQAEYRQILEAQERMGARAA